MRSTILARRYAKGLAQVAQEKGMVRELMRDMVALGEACAAVPNFVRGLADERVNIERRHEAARKVAAELRLHPAALNALLLIVDKGCARLIPRVAEYAIDIACRHEGIARAKLTVAERSVAKTVKQEVEKALADATRLKVECSVEVDPSLIGGFTVKMDDKRFDASVAGKLARMKVMLYDGAEEF